MVFFLLCQLNIGKPYIVHFWLLFSAHMCPHAMAEIGTVLLESSVQACSQFTASMCTCRSHPHDMLSFPECRSLLVASQTEPDSGGVFRW